MQKGFEKMERISDVFSFNFNHVDLPVTRIKKSEVQILNELPGNLVGYNCLQCRNKGIVYYFTPSGETVYKPCDCMTKRAAYTRLEKSGLKGLADRYRLETFKTDQPFQKLIFDRAVEWIKHLGSSCFFISGQSGAGKSHICTAIVNKLIEFGYDAAYLQWREDSTYLKANINDDIYSKKMSEYKKVDVLYIDDLFKSQKGKLPTAADINIAFELLNSRYVQNGKYTIISTELFLNDIISFDEAIGGRLKEMAGNFVLQIARENGRNYRLR